MGARPWQPLLSDCHGLRLVLPAMVPTDDAASFRRWGRYRRQSAPRASPCASMLRSVAPSPIQPSPNRGRRCLGLAEIPNLPNGRVGGGGPLANASVMHLRVGGLHHLGYRTAHLYVRRDSGPRAAQTWRSVGRSRRRAVGGSSDRSGPRRRCARPDRSRVGFAVASDGRVGRRARSGSDPRCAPCGRHDRDRSIGWAEPAATW